MEGTDSTDIRIAYEALDSARDREGLTPELVLLARICGSLEGQAKRDMLATAAVEARRGGVGL